LIRIGDRTWLARNNDLWLPELWGYVTVKEIDGRLPTICFGLEGELFIATGINAAGLWLHYNYLPAWDRPAGQKPVVAPYVLSTILLETCRGLNEVEAWLRAVDRSGGLMLFAVEGATDRAAAADKAAIFECSRTAYTRCDLGAGWIGGTNHYLALEVPQAAEVYAPHSVRRYERLAALLDGCLARGDDLTQPGLELPDDLVSVLADDGVEQWEAGYGTVYANVACPADRALWYTFGGYPAASAGHWQPLPWPWK
jgi:hypothetical protein